MNSPIAVFLYNRPQKTYNCLKSISLNYGFKDSPLYIFIDGPKNKTDMGEIEKIKKIIIAFNFNNLIELNISTVNKGLANSIYQGVQRVFKKHETIIVIEDDLIFNKNFLNFLNKCLTKYLDKSIYQVSGHVWGEELKNQSNPVLIPNINSWGWATWRSKWKDFQLEKIKGEAVHNFDSKLIYKFNLESSYDYFKILKKQLQGKVDSWAIQWYYHVFINQGYTIYPNTSLVANKGMDGSGTHTISNKFSKNLDVDFKINYPDSISFDQKKFQKFCNDLKKANNENLLDKIFIRVLRLLKK